MFRSIYAWLGAFGALPADSAEVRLRKLILSAGSFATSFALAGLIGPLYLAFGETAAGLVYVGYGLFVLAMILLFGYVHKRDRLCALLLGMTALPAQLLAALLLGGFFNSHGVMLWGLFFPVMGSLVFFNRRQAALWFLAYAANISLSLFLEPWLRPANHLPPLIARVLSALNLLITALFALAMLYYFVSQRDMAFALLRREQDKAEGLLLNILPPEIADLLKNEQRVIADHFDSASILFADVVDFTPLSAAVSPIELVDILNDVFSSFDALAESHGLEKIKTIGDCYMVAAGVPRPQADHAERLVRMALAMRDEVGRRTFHGRRLEFRIGVNSGPVVAGVIGRKKFIYDLWGDAVNTASRMESHGLGGVIQITRATYELIRERFECAPRGWLTIKGKGEVEIWHVLAERPAHGGAP
ncbi:MAG TPA: adenylate/guanylate cyclase domain-containing protein [Herpetosiphonaceae bacterium]